MLKSNIHYIPADDTVVSNKDVANELEYSEDQDPSSSPARLFIEHDYVPANDLLLSNKEVAVSTENAIENVKVSSVNKELDENDNKMAAENDVQSAERFEKRGKSPEAQTAGDEGGSTSQARENEENLLNTGSPWNAAPEIVKKKRGRPRINHAKQQVVPSENSLKKETMRKVNYFKPGEPSTSTQLPPSKYPIRIKAVSQDKKYEAVKIGKLKRKRAFRHSIHKGRTSDKLKTLPIVRRGPARGRGRPRKKKLDFTDPIYHEPFKYGWRREVVFRAYTKQSRADVYYHSPEGEKLRSFVAIKQKLSQDGLSIANFTFYKGSVGINDSVREIIRLSTRAKNFSNEFNKSNMNSSLNNIIESFSDSLENKHPVAVEEVVVTPSILSTDLRDVSNNLYTNYHGITRIMDDSSQKIESLPDALHVQSSSTCSDSLTTTIETSGICPTKTTNENVDSSVNKNKLPKQCTSENVTNAYEGNAASPSSHARNTSFCQDDLVDTSYGEKNILRATNDNNGLITCFNEDSFQQKKYCKISDLPNLQYNFNKISNNVLQEMGGADALYSFNTLNKELPQDYLYPSGKENVNNFNTHFKDLSVKSMGNHYKFPNLGENSSFNCIPSKFKDINKTLKLKIERINVTESGINNKISELNGESNNADNSIPDVYKAHQSSSFIPIENDQEIDSRIIIESSSKSCSNLIFSKCVSDSKKQFKLKPSAFKRVRYTLPQQNASFPHSLASFCAGYSALKLIFTYLNVQDLIVAQKVCKVWKNLADDPLLWTKLSVNKSHFTDYLVNILCKQKTKHIKIIDEVENDNDNENYDWQTFVHAISKIKTIRVLELCSCPAIAVEETLKKCPQLEIIEAPSINSRSLKIENIERPSNLTKLQLKATTNMKLESDLAFLSKFIKLTHLSLCCITDLGKKNIEILRHLINLEDLELGECTEFTNFGSIILRELKNLKRLRLEKLQDSLSSADILFHASKLQKLTNLELVDVKVTEGFQQNLHKCKNINVLLLIPNYECEIALSNNIILKSTSELSNTLKHFIWCFNAEPFEFSQILFRGSDDDWLPFLEPVPYIEQLEQTSQMYNDLCKKELSTLLQALAGALEHKETSILNKSKLNMLSLSNLKELYNIVLPRTKVDLLKISETDN